MIKKLLIISLLFVTLFIFRPEVIATTDIPFTPEEYQLNLYRAKVLDIKDTTIINIDENKQQTIQIAEIEILNKDYKGMITEVRNTLSGNPLYDIELRKGLKISVHAEEDNDGKVSFYVMNYERSGYMLHLIALFLFLLILIGRFKGLKAIMALSVIILLILYVLIPLLLKGYSPILVSVMVCTLSTIITLTITAGFNKKSGAAIIGTIGGLIIGGLIAYSYGIIAKLTGFSTSDAGMLLYLPGNIPFDFRGLLFAGIIIGALGASMDVAISISSALTEIQKENPNISLKKLIQSGFNIGKDIMGTMVNTLILAYTGGTLSTIIIFIGYQKTLNEIVNLDSVATEIVRAITGSIGLICAIPITIFAFCILNKRQLINERGIKE